MWTHFYEVKQLTAFFQEFMCVPILLCKDKIRKSDQNLLRRIPTEWSVLLHFSGRQCSSEILNLGCCIRSISLHIILSLFIHTHPHIEDSIFIHWSYLKWRAWHFYGRNGTIYIHTLTFLLKILSYFPFPTLIHPLKLLQSSQLHKKWKCPNSTKGKKGIKLSLLTGWSNIGAGFLEKWSMSQACQCWGGFYTMPWTHFNLVSPKLVKQ